MSLLQVVLCWIQMKWSLLTCRRRIFFPSFCPFRNLIWVCRVTVYIMNYCSYVACCIKQLTSLDPSGKLYFRIAASHCCSWKTNKKFISSEPALWACSLLHLPLNLLPLLHNWLLRKCFQDEWVTLAWQPCLNREDCPRFLLNTVCIM